MATLQDVQKIRSDLSDRTLTLSLTLHACDMVTVRACEVVGRWFRNRVSFQENRGLEEVLVRKLANAILDCLQRLPAGAHVLALPDFLVEVPGLALSGLHVMVMDAKEGCRSAILRFTEFIGAVNGAFRTEIGFQDPFASYGDKLAINVLEEICLPILNLSKSFADVERNGKSALPGHFADRAREFEFQTELLKRYIFNAGMSHPRADERYLPPPEPSIQTFIVD